MGKVIEFTGVTLLDIPPDKILLKAIDKLDSVIVIGYTKDDIEYFASSIADGGTILWLLERCKQALLTN